MGSYFMSENHILNYSRGEMNAERYQENVLIPNVIPFFTHGTGTSMIFQQDGASAHYELNVRNLLDEHLGGRWIGRRGAILNGLPVRQT